MKAFVLLCLVGAVAALNREQIRGIKQLIAGLDGVYPTCNLILFSEMVDYSEADQRCRSFTLGAPAEQRTAQTGNLATVSDDGKNEDLKLLLEMAYPHLDPKKEKWSPSQWVWAGMRKTANNGGDKSAKKYSANDWEWADGSHPNTFTKWMKGQPDQKRVKQDGQWWYQNQMRINHDGKWDDTFKYKIHPYACDYQGKYIISATPHAWLGAKEACEKAGLHLAMIRNEAEVMEITAAAEFFLGPRDNSKKEFDFTNWIWTGGNDIDQEGTWVWDINGDKADWEGIPWRSPNPDDAQYIKETGQDALAISKWGKFDDSFAHTRKRPFACQCPGT